MARGPLQATLALANLSLLVLFPVAWFAPLMRASILPWPFSTTEVSVITGLQSLWASDVFLALVVTAFAILAPYLKTIGLALVHFGLADRRIMPALLLLGRLAMIDVFLVAIYITIFKGMGLGQIETAWGLYLFTGCVLAAIGIGLLTGWRED